MKDIFTNPIGKSRTTKRYARGSAFVELATIIFAMTIISLYVVDAFFAFMAGEINNRACRDAARAAAQASTAAVSESQAIAALQSYVSTNPFLGSPTFVTQDFVYQDFGGSPPADTSPYVSVTTTMTAKLPAPIIWGKSMGSSGSVNYSQTFQFPIVKTQLYLP